MKIKDLGNNWFSAYKRCVESYRIKEAFLIAHFYKPKKLYKYFSFNKFWKDNVENGTIVLNSVYNFNDPLDSRWFLDYEKILTNRTGDSEFVNNFMNGVGKESIIRTYEEDMLYLKDSYRISCFSETPCSNLMWGHYSDKHTGFCLEYDVDKLTEKFKLIMPVIYTEKPFDASDIIDMRGISDEFAEICPALFKSKDWSYEKEWRIIENAKKVECQKMVRIPEAVTGIYLGFKTLSNNKADELKTLANELNIPLYRMQRSYLSYDLVYTSESDLYKGKAKGFLI